AERAMDRDIGNERCAGRPELDAYRTAEAIADQSDARAVDQRLLGESIEAGSSARPHERAILAEHIGLRSDLLEIFRQHAEHIGGEDVIAEFRPFLRLLLGEISQAIPRMHHEDGWALAGYAV